MERIRRIPGESAGPPLDNGGITVHTVNGGFEWDERKYEANRLKHGVSFDEAVEVFDDPAAVLLPDIRHSTAQEARELLIGRTVRGVLVVIFTVRLPENRIRIISARRASRKERGLYETQGG